MLKSNTFNRLVVVDILSVELLRIVQVLLPVIMSRCVVVPVDLNFHQVLMRICFILTMLNIELTHDLK